MLKMTLKEKPQRAVLHRHGSHSAENCYQLKAQAKRLKTHNSNSSTNTNCNPHSKSKSYDQDSGKPQHNRQELNATVKAMVKKEMHGTTKGKRATAKTEQELNQFETLSISGSKDEFSTASSDAKSAKSSAFDHDQR